MAQDRAGMKSALWRWSCCGLPLHALLLGIILGAKFLTAKAVALLFLAGTACLVPFGSQGATRPCPAARHGMRRFDAFGRLAQLVEQSFTPIGSAVRTRHRPPFWPDNMGIFRHWPGATGQRLLLGKRQGSAGIEIRPRWRFLSTQNRPAAKASRGPPDIEFKVKEWAVAAVPSPAQAAGFAGEFS